MNLQGHRHGFHQLEVFVLQTEDLQLVLIEEDHLFRLIQVVELLQVSVVHGNIRGLIN